MPKPPLAAGALVDGFRLEEKIYKGSMSALWRVTHPDHGGPLVMKIPLLRYGDDPTAIIGFEVEQMIMPLLKGPHVPRFVATGDFDTQPYIVMEHVPGEALSARLKDGPLPAAEVADLGARIARALHALHRQSLVHLDMKPGNVLFRDDGTVILIDFGLSRLCGRPDLIAEESHTPAGTGAYIAPEQVMGTRDDPRSDLFAMGVMLFEMVTGKLPFGSPQSVRGLRRRLYQAPPPPRAFNPDCPPWLQEIILQCLEVDPLARPGTAAQLAFLLQHPDQVTLTERATRTKRDGTLTVVRRWIRYLMRTPTIRPSVSERLSRAPIVATAVDLSHGETPLTDAQRRVTQSLFRTAPGARLACITVLKTARIGMDLGVDKEGNNLHVGALVTLKHWAKPLGIEADRITYHVLEAPDPAAALVDYARGNHVDHLIVGARGHSALRRYLGSVSSQVVAQAPCTVTVVRPPERHAAESGTEADADERKPEHAGAD
ncbi:bifunctional serine/threonine-protein kinase/universal stress protein [Azospirillum sp.]|uniref:serine/threonine protein kinase n=1 Tax=Azospirillum sp. TaxID=34012 RepID=UPI002D58E257|nr:bifunctional serine/threonine-protein kinase/universal stress protein [Azospirillum sp.]HYD68315.1 bifunctional serine/threonine-protein kinase/universal stress protein [Azospirillum sp.]